MHVVNVGNLKIVNSSIYAEIAIQVCAMNTTEQHYCLQARFKQRPLKNKAF